MEQKQTARSRDLKTRERVNFVLSSALMEMLRSKAKETGKPMSRLIDEALEQYLHVQRSQPSVLPLFHSIEEFWKPAQNTDLSLKKCPFCDSQEITYYRYQSPAGNRWGVMCCGCMATIDPGWAPQRSDVQALWNRRTDR